MNYREEVMRTLNPSANYSKESRVALRLSAKCSNVADDVKKFIFHGKPYDSSKLILELGDIRWYLESFAFVLGVTMEEIEAQNIAKLRARFPEGFTNEDANGKKDEVKL